MTDFNARSNQIQIVSSFQDLISTPFQSEINALCWSRQLTGDFSEIVKKVELSSNILELSVEDLLELHLSKNGQLAREIILNDLKVLKSQGASPVLNLIKNYERDDSLPFFSTDVYSYHVDRSPVSTDTYLCTYHGASSDIIPNDQADQKILIPEIRNKLKDLFDGPEESFESFLSEYFFDLHYQPKANAQHINLGKGNMWKLAVDHPESKVLPCLHRAPAENDGETRLMIIC